MLTTIILIFNIEVEDFATHAAELTLAVKILLDLRNAGSLGLLGEESLPLSFFSLIIGRRPIFCTLLTFILGRWLLFLCRRLSFCFRVDGCCPLRFVGFLRIHQLLKLLVLSNHARRNSVLGSFRVAVLFQCGVCQVAEG